jgi:hypothetical protein
VALELLQNFETQVDPPRNSAAAPVEFGDIEDTWELRPR